MPALFTMASQRKGEEDPCGIMQWPNWSTDKTEWDKNFVAVAKKKIFFFFKLKKDTNANQNLYVKYIKR